MWHMAYKGQAIKRLRKQAVVRTCGCIKPECNESFRPFLARRRQDEQTLALFHAFMHFVISNCLTHTSSKDTGCETAIYQRDQLYYTMTPAWSA